MRQDVLLGSKNYREGAHIKSSKPGTEGDRSHSKDKERAARRVAAADL